MKKLDGIIFMYSGQGSQYYHMGAELFNHNHSFRVWMEKQDMVARRYAGESIIKAIYDPKKKTGDSFDNLSHTHPAIFMVAYALTQVVKEMGVTPDYVLGTSLGEYIALAVAGVCSYEEVLEILIKESQLLKQQETNNTQKQGMMVVLDSKDVFFNHKAVFGSSQLAADNFEGHFVIAGTIADLQNGKKYLDQQQIVCQLLPIEYAFHSSYIDNIENEFKRDLANLEYEKAHLPIISSVYKTINPPLTVQYLWDIVRLPISFRETLDHVKQQGDFLYVDLGVGGSLATFVNCNLSSNKNTYSILSPYGGSTKKLNNLMDHINNPSSISF